MKKMLIVAGSGGHSSQALLLMGKLEKKFDYCFMLERNDPLTAKKLNKYRVYKVTQIRGKNEGKFVTLFRIVICCFESFFIFLRTWPDMILSTGPGIAIPVSLIGRFFGKKVIFIESWSRVTTKSISGRILYKHSDLFFVQWPEMLKLYPQAVYAGRLA